MSVRKPPAKKRAPVKSKQHQGPPRKKITTPAAASMSAAEYNLLAEQGGTYKYNKYNNIKTVVDDIPFDSKGEALRYKELKLMLKAGMIRDLRLQVPFEIRWPSDNDKPGILICKYLADFVYIEKSGKETVEDFKGVVTREFSLKKKMMLACHGIEIRITKRGK